MFEEFKKFIMRGNVLDLAVGVIIGASFGSIVKSLVDDILMPPIGLLLGGFDFSTLMLVIKAGAIPPPYSTADLAKEAGAVTINYGLFINNLITFLIIAFAIFLLIRVVNRLYVTTKDEPATAEPINKECPFCVQEIPVKASRCPYCTSTLEQVAA
jgi:large conductance mechanosensitive channel